LRLQKRSAVAHKAVLCQAKTPPNGHSHCLLAPARCSREKEDDMATARKPAARKTPATARAALTDATLLLTRDHAEVKKLFKEYKKLAEAEADGEERQALAEQICAMLTVHATLEEEIFYPAARQAEVESDLLDEAEVEHASAKDLIAQIQGMAPDDDSTTPRSRCSASTSTTTCRKKKARCSRSAARPGWNSPIWRSSSRSARRS
jgi:hypothetical protein